MQALKVGVTLLAASGSGDVEVGDLMSPQNSSRKESTDASITDLGNPRNPGSVGGIPGFGGLEGRGTAGGGGASRGQTGRGPRSTPHARTWASRRPQLVERHARRTLGGMTVARQTPNGHPAPRRRPDVAVRWEMPLIYRISTTASRSSARLVCDVPRTASAPARAVRTTLHRRRGLDADHE